MEINILIMRRCNDKTISLDRGLFNNLNCVNQRSVSYDEHLLYKMDICRLVVEVNFRYVPDFELAWGVTGYESVIVLGHGTCWELIVIGMLAVESERWLVISGEFIKTPESQPLVSWHWKYLFSLLKNQKSINRLWISDGKSCIWLLWQARSVSIVQIPLGTSRLHTPRYKRAIMTTSINHLILIITADWHDISFVSLLFVLW